MNCKRSQALKANPRFFRAVIQRRVIDCTYMNIVPRCRVKVEKGRKYRVITYKWDNDVGRLKKYFSEEKDMKPKEPDENGVMRNKRSLRQIFTKMRQLINCNFDAEDSDRELFVTLTYRENMQDGKRLYKDFDKFIKRLKHNHSEHEFLYIAIVEPQARGAWHIHLLLKTLNQPRLYIPHEAIERLWGHGMTRTERLDVDNLGSYFIAYLSNAELDDNAIRAMEVPESDIKIKDGKKYLKGSRLKWYPDYMQIYRNSRNVVKPSVSNNPDAAQGEVTFSHLTVIETERDGEKAEDVEILSEQQCKKGEV